MLAFLLVLVFVAVILHVPICFTTRESCLSSHSAGHADVPCDLRAQRLEICCKLFLQAQTGQRKPMNRPNTTTFGRQRPQQPYSSSSFSTSSGKSVHHALCTPIRHLAHVLHVMWLGRAIVWRFGPWLLLFGARHAHELVHAKVHHLVV